LHAMTLTEQLLLLAVMVETGYGRRVTTTGKVYRRYVELAKLANLKPVTLRRASSVLRDLAREGVLYVRVHSSGRYGRTSLIKLLQPPSNLCPALVEDLVIGEVAEEICGGIRR
jgi:Cdc6-like AAA superfamily ATPase